MEQFARDFGYLDKFLANMAKHAETLPPERGSRVKQLMAEEIGRWEEVKRLLAGGVATSGAAANTPATTPATPVATATSTAAGGPAKVGPIAPSGLTVGSLLGVPKK